METPTEPSIEPVTDVARRQEICGRILRSLPGWFGIEEAIDSYVAEVADLEVLAAQLGGESVGFAALKDHNHATMEIHVMGILPDFHGRGIGRRLVETCTARARGRGRRFLTVKTLSPSHPSEHYAATRGFYTAMGFLPLEEFPTLWGEQNPCLMMVKVLE